MLLSELQQKFKISIVSSSAEFTNLALPINMKNDSDRTSRISIYQCSYRNRLINSLKEDFPETIAVLSAYGIPTELLLEGYIALGSSSWTLAEAGRNLPEYIDAQFKNENNWFGDVARFEYALLLAASAGLRGTVANLVILNSSIQLLTLNLNIKSFDNIRESKKLINYIVWEWQDRIRWQEFSEEEFNFLVKLREKEEFSKLADELNFDEEKIFNILSRWTKSGLILNLA